MKLWEGLGYYSRARNLHRAAQQVVSEHDGRVPSSPDAFRALPGVGPYTAAAVLSLAFDEPLAVLDGNVIRVLSRVFALDADTRQGRTRKALQDVSDRLLDANQPGRWNESVMELGATVCTPRSPACPRCPLNGVCQAYALGTPEAFPVVSKRKAVPHHVVAVGLVMDGGSCADPEAPAGRDAGRVVGVPRWQGRARRDARSRVRTRAPGGARHRGRGRRARRPRRARLLPLPHHAPRLPAAASAAGS